MGLTLLLAAGLLLGADAKDDAAKKELKKLEGTWILESGEKDGTKLTDDVVKKSKIIWKGGDVTIESPHQSKEPMKSSIVAIDPAKKPGEMEWKRSVGPDKDKSMLAIYEWIDDDHYRVCFAPGGKDRPKEFKTKEGSGHILHVWKRVKE